MAFTSHDLKSLYREGNARGSSRGGEESRRPFGQFAVASIPRLRPGEWGKVTEARAALYELLKSATETYVPPYNISVTYLAVGEREKALDYLEKGVAEKDVRMVFLKVEPQWEQLRKDQRFVDLIKRMGIE